MEVLPAQDTTCSVENLRSFFLYGIKGLSATLQGAVINILSLYVIHTGPLNQ